MNHLRQINMAVGLFVVVVALSTGCDATTNTSPKKSNGGGHGAHPTVGPNGGIIVEGWANHELHPVFLRDAGEGKVTVNIYDHDVEDRVAIEASEIQFTVTNVTPPAAIKLAAVPMAGESGKSSRFEGTHKLFGSEKKLKGKLLVTLKGKNHVGDVDESEKE